MPVKMTVGIIVQGSTRLAHQYCSGDEKEQLRQRRPSIRRNPERAERRPEQQQATDGLIKAKQLQIQGTAGSKSRMTRLCNRAGSCCSLKPVPSLRKIPIIID